MDGIDVMDVGGFSQDAFIPVNSQKTKQRWRARGAATVVVYTGGDWSGVTGQAMRRPISPWAKKWALPMLTISSLGAPTSAFTWESTRATMGDLPVVR